MSSSQGNTTMDPGEAQRAAEASVGTFLSALLFNGVLAVALFVAFCIVRHWSKKIYQPRTYLVPAEVASPELPTGAFSWITTSFKVNDNVLLERIGLDAYMFLRFLRMSAYLFGGFSLLGLPILIPLNVVGGIGGAGLGNATLGNVSQAWRLWFHLGLTIIFSLATIGMLWREMAEYTRRRHAYLQSEKHALTPQATTILVTAIPKGLNTIPALTNIFGRFPGGVKKIWLNRDPGDLAKLCEERDAIVTKLEMAEYNYIRSAYATKDKKDPSEMYPERPQGKVAKVPMVGPKVDLVQHYSTELVKLNQAIEAGQNSEGSKTLNSAFIQFYSQFAAHSAVQTVVHPTPFKMAPMFVEISPLDVVWDHMNLDTMVRKVRHGLSFLAATGLVLLWFFPVLFVSTIANISSLVKTFSFLSFLLDLPAGLLGIIQGILPPLFLAILMALLPIILTAMATFEGHVRNSDITRSVMKKYFFFLVVNVLLVSTLSGGVIKTVDKFKDGGFKFEAVIAEIATKLPEASTFFVTYALLQGLTGPVMELLQIAPLVLNFLFTKLLAKSPRQIWNVQGRLKSVNYGVLFPPQTLMFCIGILYSTIAPMVLPFVAFYFLAYSLVYRHQFLYVYHQPVETGGLAFPVAVKQVFTGLFIFEVTVFGIFLLKQVTLNALPHMILMVVLILVTAIALSNMNEAFDPLVTFLPVALFSEELSVDQDGVVCDGSSPTPALQDEELAGSGAGEKSSTRALAPSSLHEHRPIPLTSLGVPGEKQELDDVGTVSSQLPAIPTPNRSEVDAVSFSHRSTHPPGSIHNNTTTANATANAHQMEIAERLEEGVTDEKDPVLQRLQDQAYRHPAMYNEQTPVWLPIDDRGLVQEEMTSLTSLGIRVATDGAALDSATAKASVSGILFAPGEEARFRLERGV